MRDYPWSAAYVSAVLETDFSKMAEKIDRAERAISERAFRGSQIGPDEQRYIDGTIAALQVLRAERFLKKPGPLESPVWIVRRRKQPVQDHLFGSVG